MPQGRYYLGRVIKLGQLNQELFINTITKSPIVNIGKFAWAITDVIDKRNDVSPYIFGHLSKFATDGQVKKVDTGERSQIDEVAKNLLIASSPFVYLPQYSGIAYLHVWNQIQEDVFPRRFKSIIEAAFDNIFVECSIKPISDYGTFIAKLREIDQFVEISATVHPPNPLFGRLWESLKDYVDKRNASELSVKETSTKRDGIDTNIINLMDGIQKNPQFSPKYTPDITDSALLMATDGYGRGKVIGEHNGEERIIKTSDTKKSFLNDKEPVIHDLATKATKQFELINRERDMKH